jgi:protein PsiE
MRQNSFTHHAETLLGFIEYVGLTVITIATVIAAGIEVVHMFGESTVILADLLLMFLYLEILAMVSMYFESGKLPVRFPIYIAIVALARYLVLDMKNLDVWHMVGVASSIFLLTVAVLVLRYGHVRFSYGEHE